MYRFLQKFSGPSLLVAPILYISGFKCKKVRGEKPTGVFDKVTTFVKNNAGTLTFMSFLPCLMEEGLASIRGAKLAKPHLTPQLFKKLNIANGKAFLSYLGTALITTLAVKSTSWVHDKIVKL